MVSGIFVYSVLNIIAFSNFIKMASANTTTHDYFKSKVKGNGNRTYPIIYNENYDFTFYGMEKLLITFFDPYKWSNTHKFMADHYKDNYSWLTQLKEADEKVLSTYHTPDYVKNIQYNNTLIVEVAGLPHLYWVPNFILRRMLIEPVKWHTSGTVLAYRQAMLHGTAVNMGGGWHHASKTPSTGTATFNFIGDIGFGIQYLWDNVDKNLKFFIVDLDAHQGNGHATDKYVLPESESSKILTMDMYNKDILPKDEKAKLKINFKIEVTSGISNDEYLDKLTKAFKENREEIIKFKPDLIIYNAGTDILEGNRLGLMNLDEQGIIQRDEFIFKFCRDNGFPVALLLSGGGEKINPEVTANSIINLIEKGLIKPMDKN